MVEATAAVVDAHTRKSQSQAGKSSILLYVGHYEKVPPSVGERLHQLKNGLIYQPRDRLCLQDDSRSN